MLNTTNFQDTAQLFANAIALFLRTDAEYRASWRYKHRQEALKLPRREALKNASAWAALAADHLELQERRNTLENYTGKMWEAWEAFLKKRSDYLDDRTAKNLEALRSSEAALKTSVRSVNALIEQ